DSAAPKIAQSLAKGIRDHADKGDFELVMQPKTEPDDRFFLRLHHKFKKGALVGDEVQMIRVIGLNLVTVAATAFTDSPDEAKKDPKIRDALVEEIVNGEKASFKFDGANVVGETETVKDNRFLKKVRIRYEKADSKIQVTSRIRRVGDAVMSVAMASVEASANDVDKLADDVAMTLRPK